MESRHFIIVWDLSIPVQSSYIPALGRISGTHFQACQHDMSGAQKSTLGWIPNLLMFNQLVVVIQFSHNPEETKNSGNKGLILWCIKKSKNPGVQTLPSWSVESKCMPKFASVDQPKQCAVSSPYWLWAGKGCLQKTWIQNRTNLLALSPDEGLDQVPPPGISKDAAGRVWPSRCTRLDRGVFNLLVKVPIDKSFPLHIQWQPGHSICYTVFPAWRWRSGLLPSPVHGGILSTSDITQRLGSHKRKWVSWRNWLCFTCGFPEI